MQTYLMLRNKIIFILIKRWLSTSLQVRDEYQEDAQRNQIHTQLAYCI